MKKKYALHKALSMLLTMAMVLNMAFTPVFAEEMAIEDGELLQSEDTLNELTHTMDLDINTLAEDELPTTEVTDVIDETNLRNVSDRAGVINVADEAEFESAVNSSDDNITIQPTNDITLNSDITISKTITIDLNGLTLTCDDNINFSITDTGNLTICDSDSDGKGKFFGEKDPLINNAGELKITGGTICRPYAPPVDNDGWNNTATGTAIINTSSGNTIIEGNTAVNAGSCVVRSESDSSGNITINDNPTLHTLNGLDYATAIMHYGSGKVNINGGVVKNNAGGTVILNDSTSTINISGNSHIISGGFGNNASYVIRNSKTGDVNITGGILEAEGKNTQVISNNTSTPGGYSGPAGTVTLTNCEVISGAGNGIAIFNRSGTVKVGNGTKVYAKNDEIGISNDNETFNDSGTIEIGDNVKVQTTGNGIAISNKGTGATLIVDGDNKTLIEVAEKLDIDNTPKTIEYKEIKDNEPLTGIAIYNEATAIIKGGTVKVVNPGDVAVTNAGKLDIVGGVVGRVALYTSSSGATPTTYVHGQTEDSLEDGKTGVPIPLLASSSGSTQYRIAVKLPDVSTIATMLTKVTETGVTLPSNTEPLGFFELAAESSTDGTSWSSASLPANTKLVMPFPTGLDNESNNYKICHFASGANSVPEILAAKGNSYGIVCEPTSLSPFMVAMFPRYQVTFDLNYSGAPSATKIGTNIDDKLDAAALPQPTRTGYDFQGWFTAATDGTEVTLDDTYNTHSTIFAQWEVTSSQYTVTFDPNGGTMSSPTEAKTDKNGKLTLSALPEPTRTGYDFQGWFTAASGGSKVTPDYVYTRDTTIYAQWKAGASQYTITFDLNGGTMSSPTQVSTDANGKLTLTELPTPKRSGYDFQGWFTAATGSIKVTLDDVYTQDTSIYAQWKISSGGGSSTQYQVTFDLNGGTTVSPTQASTDTNGKLTLSSLPTPTWAGHDFQGWFTSATGGTKVTLTDIYTKNTTIYAQWQVSGGDSGGGSGSGGGSSSGGGNTSNTPNLPEDGQVVYNAELDNNGNFIFNLTKSLQNKLIAAKVASFTIRGGGRSITFDLEAIKHIRTTANADVMVTATKTATGSFSQETQTAISDKPVYTFKVEGGGKNITTFGKGKISIGFSYEPQKIDESGKPSDTGSLENASNILGAYINASGKLTYLPYSSFNTKSKTLFINTDHLSSYGVVYKTNMPTFTDTTNHWAKDDILFIVVRDLLAGTGDNQFTPNGFMTRGMFVAALGRLAAVDTKEYQKTKFTDVNADAYYAPYVAWASMNGIVNGTTDTTFSPEQSITRQEMAVMFVNYSNTMGYKLPSVHDYIAFTDDTAIASWAKSAVKETQMAGLLLGKDGGKFDPTATATRAEVSAMLRRFIELTANVEISSK